MNDIYWNTPPTLLYQESNGAVKVDAGGERWILLQPPEQALDVALFCDGEKVRGYVDGVERPELVQFIPAGWHPPLALPGEPHG